MKHSPALINAIASHFAHNLAQCVGKSKLHLIDHENKSISKGCCASHNHCDANVPMMQAFEEVMGRECHPQCDDDASLWGAAWDVAMKGFHNLAMQPRVQLEKGARPERFRLRYRAPGKRKGTTKWESIIVSGVKQATEWMQHNWEMSQPPAFVETMGNQYQRPSTVAILG